MKNSNGNREYVSKLFILYSSEKMELHYNFSNSNYNTSNSISCTLEWALCLRKSYLGFGKEFENLKAVVRRFNIKLLWTTS